MGLDGMVCFHVPEKNVLKGEEFEKYKHLPKGHYEHGEFILKKSTDFAVLIPKDQKGVLYVQNDVNVATMIVKNNTILNMETPPESTL